MFSGKSESLTQLQGVGVSVAVLKGGRNLLAKLSHFITGYLNEWVRKGRRWKKLKEVGEGKERRNKKCTIAVRACVKKLEFGGNIRVARLESPHTGGPPSGLC